MLAAPHPIRRAAESGDSAALAAALAHDVVLLSPVTGVAFRGRESVAALIGDVLDAAASFEYPGEVEGVDLHVLLIRMRFGGWEVDLAEVLRQDEDGLVSEIRIHGRPLAGVAALLAAVAPRLARRRRGRLAGLWMALLTRPLPHLFALSDRVVDRAGLARA